MKSVQNIYSVWPNNGFSSIVLNAESRDFVWSSLNRVTKDSPCPALSGSFYSGGGTEKPRPDISVLNAGGIAVSAELAERLFDPQEDNVTLLPIVVSNTSWFVVSSHNSFASIDESESDLMRSVTGEIFMATRLSLLGVDLTGIKLFSLENSNRMQVFGTDTLRVVLKNSSARGLNLKCIGHSTG